MNAIYQIDQTNPKMKRGKKIMMIIGIIVAVIAVCMLMGAILHATYLQAKFQ